MDRGNPYRREELSSKGGEQGEKEKTMRDLRSICILRNVSVVSIDSSLKPSCILLTISPLSILLFYHVIENEFFVARPNRYCKLNVSVRLIMYVFLRGRTNIQSDKLINNTLMGILGLNC